MRSGQSSAPSTVVRLERVSPRNQVFRSTWTAWRPVASDRLRRHLRQLAEVIDLRRGGRRVAVEGTTARLTSHF